MILKLCLTPQRLIAPPKLLKSSPTPSNTLPVPSAKPDAVPHPNSSSVVSAAVINVAVRVIVLPVSLFFTAKERTQRIRSNVSLI